MTNFVRSILNIFNASTPDSLRHWTEGGPKIRVEWPDGIRLQMGRFCQNI
jgi:hypothetical protein